MEAKKDGNSTVVFKNLVRRASLSALFEHIATCLCSSIPFSAAFFSRGPLISRCRASSDYCILPMSGDQKKKRDELQQRTRFLETAVSRHAIRSMIYHKTKLHLRTLLKDVSLILHNRACAAILGPATLLRRVKSDDLRKADGGRGMRHRSGAERRKGVTPRVEVGGVQVVLESTCDGFEVVAEEPMEPEGVNALYLCCCLLYASAKENRLH